MSDRTHLIWQQVDAMIEKLIIQNPNLCNDYELILGIARGGCIPATLISYATGIPLQICHFSTRDNKIIGDDLNLVFSEFPEGFGRILVVEDIIDTGVTANIIKETAFKHRVSIDFYSLVYNMNNEMHIPCRLHGQEHDGSWIVFPWE